jgi:cation:H+ antiporter
MIVLWISGLVVGVAVAAASSRRAVGAALETSESLGISTGLVGLSIMAVGTDLPEIANSIIASLSGHGDLNVGDSTGSALTQITLILALLILAAGLTLDLDQAGSKVAVPVGVMTTGTLVVLAIMLSDGTLGRIDGIVLVTAWFISLVWMARGNRQDDGPPRVPDGRVGRMIMRTLGWLALVGAAATVIVRSFIEITDSLGVPEFLASSIVLALGTSVPELVVNWTAIRRGAAALAIGDLFGATLIDSTLSVGIGPIVRPTAVSTQAMTGVLVIAVGVAVATLAVAFFPRRAMAGSLLAVYVAAMVTLVALAG